MKGYVKKLIYPISSHQLTYLLVMNFRLYHDNARSHIQAHDGLSVVQTIPNPPYTPDLTLALLKAQEGR